MRVIAAGSIAALLCVLSWRAAYSGAADAHMYFGRSYFDEWSKVEQPVKAGPWNEARHLLEDAHALDERNPDVLEALGQLYDWATFRKPARHAVVIEYQRQLLVYLRLAAHERPVSGYTWATIAQVKAALEEFDTELAHAIERAALLAPWEPAAQLAVVQAGLTAWPSLNNASRQTVRQTLSRAMLRQSDEVIALAKPPNHSKIVCALPELPEHVSSALCKR